MDTGELKKLLKASTAVLILDNGEPSFVILGYDSYKSLLSNQESEVQIKHTDTDSEENRPNLPESQPKNNIGTPVRASFNFQHKIGEKEAELLEKINKEILALKNEIEKEEKTVDIATVGPALEDRI